MLWAGHVAGAPSPAGLPATDKGPGMPLLGEHAHALYTRPHLRGHRLGPGGAGRSWTTRFATDRLDVADERLVVEASDPDAGLALVLDLESLVGGSLRGRWTLTNTGDAPYVVDGLEVVLPVADHLTETLDFTGRHERERTPQRRPVTDGLWLREGRGGRPGLDGAGLLVVGTAGFTTTTGEVVGVHVAWSGNSVLRVERDAATGTTVGGGELLLPGEVVLGPGESYATPWVHVASADDGLDGLAAAWHTWQRALPAHPARQPVVLNVWEAVFFDHDLDRLTGIADRAARVGVERFVLDDGWFHRRRDDTAGLGDWWIDETVWPEGLMPLIDHVRGLGMEFGLWFEPEMVNPDSDLLRRHPDWILAAGPHRAPRQQRRQQVLDLTRPEVFDFLHERMSAILAAHPIDYVKWDHNRDLLEAGSGTTQGAPAVHGQTLAFHRLLDVLRADFPDVAWESCASGGGRVDFSVLERVQRVWTSDMTDALARQQIQRWSAQLVAPEYLGAHVSSPVSHTTGRTLVPRLPVCHRAVRRVRDRVGPHRGERRRPGAAGRLGRPAQVAPPPAAQRTRRTPRVLGPVGAAARRRRGGPVRGAPRPCRPGRERPQPWRPRACAGSRRRGDVPARLGRADLRASRQHVRAARPGGPTGGTDVVGRALRTRGFWMPAAAARDGDPGAV